MSTQASEHQQTLYGEWECMDCGFVLKESASTRRPEACPGCGADASVFEFFENEEGKTTMEEQSGSTTAQRVAQLALVDQQSLLAYIAVLLEMQHDVSSAILQRLDSGISVDASYSTVTIDGTVSIDNWP